MKNALRKLGPMVFLSLALAGLVNGQGRSATVTSTRANLHETPAQSGEVQQEIPIGTEIRVLDNKGPWYVVRIADAVGWMHGNLFRFGSGSPARVSQPGNTSPPTRVRGNSGGSGVSGSSSSDGRGYIRGPRGGCYYYSRSGRKVYVDRSLCN